MNNEELYNIVDNLLDSPCESMIGEEEDYYMIKRILIIMLNILRVCLKNLKLVLKMRFL